MSDAETLFARTREFQARIGARFHRLALEQVAARGTTATEAQIAALSKQIAEAAVRIADTLARAPELDEAGADDATFDEAARGAIVQIFDRVFGAPAVN